MKTKIVMIACTLATLLAMMLGTGDYAQAKPKNSVTDEGLKAAFVRGGNLWIAIGKTEKQVGQGSGAQTPRWSPDGRWVAYAVGEEMKELWLLDVKKDEARRISANGGSNFQWSPVGGRLAYLEENKLLWTTVEQGAGSGTGNGNGNEAGEGVGEEARAGSRGGEGSEADVAGPASGAVEEVGNYGWLPDGSGFIVSSVPRTAPDGWEPIRIGTVRLNQPGQLHPLYTIPFTTGRNFAIGTGIFKWSSDGRWVAFQAVPTASFSADSNSLCVLSSDGKRFLRIGYMVRNEAWFKWSPGEARLAFIEGEGREATRNKRMKVVDVPADKPVVLTPEGYADRDFAWEGNDRIVISRSYESEWTADPAKRPLPYLVLLELRDRRQSKLTSPPGGFGDFAPAYLPPARLAWVRSDRGDRNRVLLGDDSAQKPSVWIRKLDKAPSYYEQYFWNSVLDIYSR